MQLQVNCPDVVQRPLGHIIVVLIINIVVKRSAH